MQLDQWDLLEEVEILGPLVHKVQEVRMVSLVILALQDRLDQWDHQGLEETRELWALQETQV